MALDERADEIGHLLTLLLAEVVQHDQVRAGQALVWFDEVDQEVVDLSPVHKQCDVENYCGRGKIREGEDTHRDDSFLAFKVGPYSVKKVANKHVRDVLDFSCLKKVGYNRDKDSLKADEVKCT